MCNTNVTNTYLSHFFLAGHIDAVEIASGPFLDVTTYRYDDVNWILQSKKKGEDGGVEASTCIARTYHWAIGRPVGDLTVQPKCDANDDISAYENFPERGFRVW